MSSNNYPVGYKKPPTHTQFQPGQSGNPKGRPKGLKNLATDLQEELEQKILIWNQTLVTGQVATMKELAKQEKVTQRYIAHLIKLAFLAPDIMKAIIKGDIPSTLSLDRLKKGIPIDWNEQRKILGFTP